jgi:FtsH-binding integral membrane protein
MLKKIFSDFLVFVLIMIIGNIILIIIQNKELYFEYKKIYIILYISFIASVFYNLKDNYFKSKKPKVPVDLYHFIAFRVSIHF